MKSIFTKIGTGVLVAIFLFIGLKGCIKTVIQFDTTAIYRQFSTTGESNTVYIVPDNTLIFKKQFEDQYEYGVFKARGENATHYFGSLYNRGETLLDFRIYSGALDVWKVELELLYKKGNLEKSTYEDIGETFKDLIIFRDNSVEIGKLTYDKINMTTDDEEFIKNAMTEIK